MIIRVNFKDPNVKPFIIPQSEVSKMDLTKRCFKVDTYLENYLYMVEDLSKIEIIFPSEDTTKCL